jgi:hypothetical protein
MTDREKIRAEIEKAYNEALNRTKLIKDEYWEGKVDAYRNVLCIFDSMQEEPTNIIAALDNYFATTPREQQDKDWEDKLETTIYMMEQLNLVKSWDDCYNWLQSLKDRTIPQPKQEWSEEDEEKINEIIDYLDYKGHKTDVEFLKSLRDRFTWKPSGEQK